MKTPRNSSLPPVVIALAPRRAACDVTSTKLARHLALACSALLLLGTCAAPAQSSRTNTPAPPAPSKSTAKQPSAKAAPPATSTGTVDDFKAISDRNIFNTRRYAGRTQSDTPPPTTRRERVIESVSLLGTLEYDKGRVAFFEGSGSDSRKSAKVEDTIAGCKITAIEPSAITLDANGKTIQLKVGHMMRREDQGEWQTREAERPFEPMFTSSFSPGSSFGSSSSGSPFGGSSFSSRSSSSSFNSRDSRSSSRSSSPFGGGSNPAEMAQSRIREQDRNGDGKISRDEADSRLRDRFREIDRNGDGIVDGEEYTSYYATRFGGGTSTSSAPGSSFSPSPSPFSSGSSFNNTSGSGSFGSGSTGSTGSSTGSSTPSAPPSSGGGESDLLRRLMEQRARENR